MSRHKKHSKRNNNKTYKFDINTIVDLLNNIKPEHISALQSIFNLVGSKTVNQNKIMSDDGTISKPTQG